MRPATEWEIFMGKPLTLEEEMEVRMHLDAKLKNEGR